MKNAGKATRAALKLIYWTLVFLLALMLAGVLAKFLGKFLVEIAGGLVVLWFGFCGFCLFVFFRDPEATVPEDPNVIVAPASGKVDLVDEVEELEFMGGRCQRISIFLSIFDIHVQRAPTTATVVLCRHQPGQFLNAMRAESAKRNENVLVGFTAEARGGAKVGVRLIAGLLARRVIPWIEVGEKLERGERISLIQFGSRVDLYLPLSARVEAEVGKRARGGETVVARWS
jgi:phosphatidylserine decarboxylase